MVSLNVRHQLDHASESLSLTGFILLIAPHSRLRRDTVGFNSATFRFDSTTQLRAEALYRVLVEHANSKPQLRQRSMSLDGQRLHIALPDQLTVEDGMSGNFPQGGDGSSV